MPRNLENREVDEITMKPVAKLRLRSYPQQAIDRRMNSFASLEWYSNCQWAKLGEYMLPSHKRGTTRVLYQEI